MMLAINDYVISPHVKYGKDKESAAPMRVLKVSVQSDVTVSGVVGFVESVNGNPPKDDALLKWAGMDLTMGERTIPGGTTAWLGVLEYRADGIYLHNVSDYEPREPIITDPGDYTIKIAVCAPGETAALATLQVSYLEATLSSP